MIRMSKALIFAAGTVATTGIALAQNPPPAGAPAPQRPAPTPVPTPDPTPAAPPAGEPAPPAGEPAVPPTEPAPIVQPAPPPVSAPAQPPEPEAPPPPEGPPPLTLGKGKILIAGSTITFNLSSGDFAQPISLAPSVWYGIDDKLTIGLTHDGGTTPWTPRPRIRTITTFDGIFNRLTETGGPGICVTGDDHGCSGIYDNVGVDGLYALPLGTLGLAAHGALDVGSFDPFLLQLRLGVLGRYPVSDRISIFFDPRLRFGLTNRESNQELIDLPVWAWYAVDERIGAYLHTGLAGELSDFGRTYAIPLQLGGSYQLDERLTLGLDLAFTRLNDGFGDRVLGLRAAYAL